MSEIHFGAVPGIAEGKLFNSRKALVSAGLHRSLQREIDSNGKQGVAAIIVTGGYDDDLDLGDEIIYTGHGGKDPKTKAQIANQSWEAHGNKGLVVSEEKKLPVRVIREPHEPSAFAPKSGYAYGGLYQVVDHWDKVDQNGFSVCLFKLKKINALNEATAEEIKEGTLVLLQPSGLAPKWFSIGVEAPKDAQKLSMEGVFAQEILHKNVGDQINFGQGFKVLEIKKYMCN